MRATLKDNDGSHIAKILQTTTCKKHRALEAEACWNIWIGYDKRYGPAVCGARIKRAGYVGKISPTSLSQKAGSRASGKTRS